MEDSLKSLKQLSNKIHKSTLSYDTCGRTSLSKHHIARSRCVYISVRQSAQENQEEVNPEWAMISAQTEEINSWLPGTWYHSSLCRCIVTPELFDFRFWLLKMSKATWRICGHILKSLYCATVSALNSTDSVYKIVWCQSQLNSSNRDNLAEVYGERRGKERCWAMTQTWQ